MFVSVDPRPNNYPPGCFSNYPGIIHVYDIGSDGGFDFIAMEYVAGRSLELVEGQTLAERLEEGRIPLDETLDICRKEYVR